MISVVYWNENGVLRWKVVCRGKARDWWTPWQTLLAK